MIALLELLQQHVEGLGILAEIVHDNAGAADSLDELSLAGLRVNGAELGQASHLAELLTAVNGHDGDTVLVAKSLDELDVSGLIAIGSQHTKAAGLAVQRAGGLVKTTGQTVVEEGLLEHLLQSLGLSHGLGGGGLIGDSLLGGGGGN